ncbi:MAG: hypothetical protein HYY06_27185 [Deltaproteobacteria bacterium]|nr:hypothetical protein [Deltaproteobacteria bacterium]
MDESGNGHTRALPQPPEEAPEQDALVRLGEIIGQIDRRTRELVTEHPVLALSGAMAIGWILGRLVTRR